MPSKRRDCMLLLVGFWSVYLVSSGPYSWMERDAFDFINERFSNVSGLNCHSKSKDELLLPIDAVSGVPKYNKLLSARIFYNRWVIVGMCSLHILSILVSQRQITGSVTLVLIFCWYQGTFTRDGNHRFYLWDISSNIFTSPPRLKNFLYHSSPDTGDRHVQSVTGLPLSIACHCLKPTTV